MSRQRRAALGLATVLLVGACAAPLPVPDPDPEPLVVQPAMTEAQADRIMADFAAVLATADGSTDTSALDTRLTGPALALRLNEYALRTSGLTEEVTAIPTAAQTVVVPATDAWPRTLMAVTEPPADLQAPLLLAFTQEGPRDRYRLWAWVRLFPGVTTPPFARADVGAAPIAPDSADLAMSPEGVLLGYLDLLTSGDASEYATVFLPDPLRDGIVGTRTAYTELVGDNGTLVETYNPAGEGVQAIGTYDGGAIVVGAIETVTTITLSDSTLTLGGEVAAMLGRTTVETSLAFTWLSVVAFHVPPAGSTDPVEVLGAEHTLTSVTGE